MFDAGFAAWILCSVVTTLTNKENNSFPSTLNNIVPENPPAKNFMDENKIIIPGISENYPGTSTFYNNPSTNKKTSAKINKPKIEEPKKILIEEIKQKIKIRIQRHCYMRIQNNKLLQELGTT